LSYPKFLAQVITTEKVTDVFADIARAIAAQHAAQLSADKLFAQQQLPFDAIKSRLVDLEKALTASGVSLIEQYKKQTGAKDTAHLTIAFHKIITGNIEDFVRSLKQ